RGEADRRNAFRTDRERGLFPTFFFTGFECSTFIWKDRKRRDYDPGALAADCRDAPAAGRSRAAGVLLLHDATQNAADRHGAELAAVDRVDAVVAQHIALSRRYRQRDHLEVG